MFIIRVVGELIRELQAQEQKTLTREETEELMQFLVNLSPELE